MKIILFGGTGCLGQELLKIDSEIIAPTRGEVNIVNFESVKEFIFKHKTDIVINAAAETDNRKVEKYPETAITTNIIGSGHIAMACREIGARLVYLSTDYIYKGDRGNYSESDEILPFNLYSWTKLGGECSTRAVENHLIIRTSFGKNEFEYKQAFTDKWSSKDYVDVLASQIYESAISPLTGVLNIGTARKTLYGHASERSHVLPVKIKDTNYHTPYDTSLDCQKWIDYNSENKVARPHLKCRACGSDKLNKYLDLGLMPLANNLEFTAVRAKNVNKYPLQVMKCENCSLSQLSVVIDPEVMFSNYTYRSSVNKGYVNHCTKMAADLQAKYQLTNESFVIDIAGNDGTLLKEFKELIGCRVLNIEPAQNLAAIAESQEIEVIADFWTGSNTWKILNNYPQADIIIATNVFAHVDDCLGFLSECRFRIKQDGLIILEFPYIRDFINYNEFDTVYFEHLSYFSIKPLDIICKNLELSIKEIQLFPIHGGSVRVTIGRGESMDLTRYLESESNIDYSQYSKIVKTNIEKFGVEILNLKKQGAKIAAFAASAKGNTLLNSCGINTDLLDYIVDETPEKIGKFSPGTGIPIVNKQKLLIDPPDYLVILSWNFKEEIMKKLENIYKGYYIIPIPDFNIIYGKDY